MLDVLISHGTIVDGTGGRPAQGSVGIKGRRVVAVGKVDEPARRRVDASGLVVAPGFVDVHTHYDAQLFWDPNASPSPLHGVTTVMGGNCGFTIAPLVPREADYLMRMMARVEGMPLDALAAGLPWDWTTFGDWLDRLDGRIAVNAGFLVGHSAIRRAVLGSDAVSRAATKDEITAMADVLRSSLSAGAVGFSTSRAPTHSDGDGRPVPSRWADEAELLALASVVREFPATTVGLLPAVGPFSDEVIELMTALSLAADRPVNWNVLGASPEGHHLRQLEASDRAAVQGGRVVALTLPEVPRPRLSLRTGFVFDSLPEWGPVMALPLVDRARALADAGVRRRLFDGACAPEARALATLAAQWAQMEVAEAFAASTRHLVGRSVGSIAAERGVEPFDAFLDLALADDLRTGFLPPPLGDDDGSWSVRGELWADERTVIGGSDAGAHVDMQCGATYSTSLLGTGVRERRLIDLAEAVHQLTDVPARLYGLRDRGRLQPGWLADLVVFDADTIAPEPVRTVRDLPGGAERLYASARGVVHVFVNGVEIVDGGAFTGEVPGTVLRSGRDFVEVRP